MIFSNWSRLFSPVLLSTVCTIKIFFRSLIFTLKSYHDPKEILLLYSRLLQSCWVNNVSLPQSLKGPKTQTLLDAKLPKQVFSWINVHWHFWNKRYFLKYLTFQSFHISHLSLWLSLWKIFPSFWKISLSSQIWRPVRS